MIAIAQARSELARAFPELPLRSVRLLAGGWDFLTVEVNRRWVFRFPGRPAMARRLGREFSLLPLLGRRLGVPVPEYRFRWEPTRTCPHRIGGYARLPGVRFDRAGLSRPGLERVGQELGDAVRKLHRVPAADAVAAGLPFRTPRAVRNGVLRWCRRVRAHASPLLNSRSRGQFDRLVRRLASSDLPSFSSVVTHNDLLPPHVLVDPRSGALTGVIDWGDVEFGDPAFDFGVMGARPHLGPAMIRAYGVPPDPGFFERADAYRRLVASHAVVHAIETRDPLLRSRGLRAFARALASPGPAAEHVR